MEFAGFDCHHPGHLVAGLAFTWQPLTKNQVMVSMTLMFAIAQISNLHDMHHDHVLFPVSTFEHPKGFT